MSRQYTRQEAIALSGITSSKASYFERVGLVVPAKIGASKKPYVFYSGDQIEVLKQLDRLSNWFNHYALQSFVKDDQIRQAMLTFLDAVSP